MQIRQGYAGAVYPAAVAFLVSVCGWLTPNNGDLMYFGSLLKHFQLGLPFREFQFTEASYF